MKASRRKKRSVRRSKSFNEDRKKPLEELFSGRIEELMDFGVFRKYWKSLFGNERRMLIKKALRVKLHKRSTILTENVVATNSIHHKDLSIDGR